MNIFHGFLIPTFMIKKLNNLLTKTSLILKISNCLKVFPLKNNLYILLITIPFFLFPIISEVSAMENNNQNESISKLITDYRNDQLSDMQITNLLETINNLDPVRDQERINVIRNYLAEQGINLTPYLNPNITYGVINDHNTAGNPSVQNTWTWQSAVKSVLLAAGILITGYLIIRYWNTIQETLFSTAHYTWESIPHTGFVRATQSVILQNPTQAVFIYNLLLPSNNESA